MREHCRICLSNIKTDECVGINIKVSENKSVLNLIKEWAFVQVNKPDELPQMICEECFTNVKAVAEFIKQIQNSDQTLKQKLNRNSENVELKEKSEDKLFNTTLEECSNSDKDQCSMSPDLIKNNVATKQYECTDCRKMFETIYHYKIHRKTHSSNKMYSCQKCGKNFVRSYGLLYHMRVHTGEKKFKCKVCSKSFIHPSSLYKHRKIHTNTRNYKCELCSKSFIQSEALKIHIRRSHTGEKPFLCEFCSKFFSSQSALWLHKQDRHEEKKPCNICNKYYSNRMLKRHLERHLNRDSNNKKYICEQCGKSFSADHNLRQHLLSHDGIKPYATQPMPCPFCKKLYSKRRIKNHVCIVLEN